MPSHIVTHHGHAVAIANRQGFFAEGTDGFYFRLTRFLSRLRVTIDGADPRLVAASEVNSQASIAYYLAPTPAGKRAGPEPESDKPGDEIVQKGIELQINRFVGGGFCDEIFVTNYALAPADVGLRWEIDADFADYSEAAKGERQQNAPVAREWRASDRGGALILRYAHPKLPHAAELRFSGDGEFTYGETVCCTLHLEQQNPVRLCIALAPVFCGERIEPLFNADMHAMACTAAMRKAPLEMTTSNRLVQSVWDQAAADLVALALLEGDEVEQRTPAAGIPKYTALFGRDVLVTAFQAGCFDPLMLRGSLRQVA
jgi:glycogen debranching enzyme